MTAAPGLYLGMLSGTSRDGADTVLVRFDGDQPELVAAHCLAYPDELADALRRLIERHRRPNPEELASLDRELAEFFALSAWNLLDQAGIPAERVKVIGSHGQTVWHNPRKPQPETIQLGDPQRISDLLGIKTVGHFRQADVAAGGQGAPLAPLLHRALLQPAAGRRAVLNIGGIANLSLLDADGRVCGYDTGPGNCLLDAWIRRHSGRAFDSAGAWAAGGTVDEGLLRLLLADPFFAMPPPRSTGVEYFNVYWLESRIAAGPAAARGLAEQDIQATLAELTARSIADRVRAEHAGEVLVCGGGTHNEDLMRRLQRLLPGIEVSSTARRGLDPDWVEGILFAWLARERLAARLQDTRPITGAREPVLLGDLFSPS